jgi:hypothetical protein
MKTFKPSEYDNEAEVIHMSSERIESSINLYPLDFIQLRVKSVEWGMELPMFVPSFYDFILNNYRIPMQVEYWVHYQRSNDEWFKRNRLNVMQVQGLKARIYRTYPSLVRDIHFAKYVSENLDVEKVIYNQKLDIEEGIDLMILNGNNYFAINLFTNTGNAHFGRQKKTFRHINFTNVKYLDVPVEFKGSIKCGNFFLYGNRELIAIKSSIRIH